jgi:hypothetical protein
MREGSVVSCEGILNQMPLQIQTWDLRGEVAKDIQGQKHEIFLNTTKARLLR